MPAAAAHASMDAGAGMLCSTPALTSRSWSDMPPRSAMYCDSLSTNMRWLSAAAGRVCITQLGAISVIAPPTRAHARSAAGSMHARESLTRNALHDGTRCLCRNTLLRATPASAARAHASAHGHAGRPLDPARARAARPRPWQYAARTAPRDLGRIRVTGLALPAGRAACTSDTHSFVLSTIAILSAHEPT